MNRLVSLILLITLSLPLGQVYGQGQGQGRGKPKPPREPMGVIFFDGFERADLSPTGSADNYPWSLLGGGTTENVRTGERALQGNATGSQARSRYFDISGTDRTDWSWDIPDMWVSFYVLIDSNATAGLKLFSVDAASAGALDKLELWWAANNTIQVRDQNETIIATGTTQLQLDTWYRIDVRCGTGVSAPYELRIHEDGSPGTSIELSGTFDQRVDNIAEVSFSPDSQAVEFAFIDDVVFDDTGYFADGNDYRVESYFPDGDGTYTDWTGDWTDVAGKAHDGETTEITTTDDPNAQTVTLEDMPALVAGETIEAVMLIVHARKGDGVGTLNIQIRDRVFTTDRDSATFELQDTIPPTDSRQKWWAIHTTKPGNGNYTSTDINNYELGIVHAQSQSRAAFCTAMNINVLVQVVKQNPVPVTINREQRKYQVDAKMIPLGYQQISDISTVQSLSPPPGTRVACVKATAQDVRWRDDGSSPSASIGMVLDAETEMFYRGNFATLKFIEMVGGAILDIVYYF